MRRLAGRARPVDDLGRAGGGLLVAAAGALWSRLSPCPAGYQRPGRGPDPRRGGRDDRGRHRRTGSAAGLPHSAPPGARSPAGSRVRSTALLQRRPALVQARGESRRWRRRPLATTPLRANLRVDHAGGLAVTPLRGDRRARRHPGSRCRRRPTSTGPSSRCSPASVASGAGSALRRQRLQPRRNGSALARDAAGPPRRCSRRASALGRRGLRRRCPRRAGGRRAAGRAADAVRAGRRRGRARRPRPSGRPLRPLVRGPAVRRGVDREARRPPAPPAAMAGYCGAAAVSTTATGTPYTLFARADLPVPAVLVSCAFALVAARRLERRRAPVGGPRHPHPGAVDRRRARASPSPCAYRDLLVTMGKERCTASPKSHAAAAPSVAGRIPRGGGR